MFEKLLGSLFSRASDDKEPAEAYDLWSSDYDDQPDNLMLALDDNIFSILLKKANPGNKVIIDIGCGTGRHWSEIMKQEPISLTGYDVSPGMLEKLRRKFPDGRVYLLQGNKLPGLENESCDLVISTLTAAHIDDLEDTFNEWNRILKKGGELLITDYHPEILIHGGKRTFIHDGKTISVKNNIHTIGKILELTNKMNWELLSLEERKIDDTVRSYYERKGALTIFEKFKGLPVIFGMHLKKRHVIA